MQQVNIPIEAAEKKKMNEWTRIILLGGGIPKVAED